LLILLVLGGAVFAGIKLRLIPLDFRKAPPSPVQEKLVVRYVLAERLQAGRKPPGSVYIAEVRGDNERNLSFDVGVARLRQEDYANRVKEAQSQADLARVNYERVKNLVKSQTVPQAQLDQATANKKAAEAQLAAAEQALRDTVLKATEDGTILSRSV